MDTLKKIGRYEILEELGHGAMGTVYRAKDPAMGRVVALKTIISLVLVSEQGSDFRERFFREARAAGGLSHPGIVTVYDVGEHEGLPYLVMEFISGKTLAEIVRQGERLTIDRVCEIGQKIAEALGYAHQRGVVHRDIKPANILLTSREEYGIERPKITDFGVAKLTQGNTTMTGQILGTPAFMPPEQFTGAPIDGRADIFSLGVVLYWMATGEQPFPGESLTAVSYKVVHIEPVPPRKLNPAIPAKLEGVILKCLAKNPEERYQTGEDLAHELSELRMGNTATGLLSTAAQSGIAGIGDMDATLVETFPAASVAQGQPPLKIPAQVAATPKTGRNVRIALTIIIVAAIAVGSWFAMRNVLLNELRNAESRILQKELPPVPAEPPAASKSASGSATGTGKSSNSGGKPANEPKIAGNTQKSVDKLAAPADSPEPSKEPVTVPQSAAVDFNPTLLDPKANAKLKIEAEHMPTGVNFAVEMNGKLFLQLNAAGNKMEFDNLYVPPGVQEFRVTAGNGADQKASNIVSTEFQAKKKHTLKIDVRSPGMSSSSGVPQGLNGYAQIVVTLK